MATPRFNLIADLELPLRALSEAISTIMASIHELRKVHKGAVVEESIKALSRALSSAMATPHRPTALTFQHATKPYWCKLNAATGQPSRAEIVQVKLAELKRASSPSDAMCFKCGDRGHFAAQCCNATLCFICNCHGHRSSQCCANTSFELPKSDPLLLEVPTDTLPEPPLHPSQFTPLSADSESGQQSLPIEDEVLTMVSIKKMEMELAEFKHEMELMEKKRFEMELAMEGINAQIQKSKSKKDEIEVSETTQENVSSLMTSPAIEVNEDHKGFEGVEPVKVQLVDMQQINVDIEATRQKDSKKENLTHETEIEKGVSLNPKEGSASTEKKVGWDVEAIRQKLLNDIEAIVKLRQKNLRGGSLHPRRSGGRRVKS